MYLTVCERCVIYKPFTPQKNHNKFASVDSISKHPRLPKIKIYVWESGIHGN